MTNPINYLTTVETIADASHIEYPTEVIEVKEEQKYKTWIESEKNVMTDDDIKSTIWPLWRDEIKNMVREMATRVRTELPEPLPAQEESSSSEDDEDFIPCGHVIL